MRGFISPYLHFIPATIADRSRYGRSYNRLNPSLQQWFLCLCIRCPCPWAASGQTRKSRRQYIGFPPRADRPHGYQLSDLHDRGKGLLHIIPLAALPARARVDLQRALARQELLRPIAATTGYTPRFNFDGFINIRGGAPRTGIPNFSAMAASRP